MKQKNILKKSYNKENANLKLKVYLLKTIKFTI